MRFILLICLLPAIPLATWAQQSTPEDMRRWLEDEGDRHTDEVNEGQLQFLHSAPARPPLHSENKIVISAKSIEHGWVDLHQCYRHLAAVPSAEVVYKYKQMRNMQLLRYRNIGHARIIGQSVQLRNVGQDAELCIKAEIRNFYQNSDGSFSLVNGPFHRRFLDGFYPYRVSLEIRFPGDHLAFVRSRPPSQSGFVIKRGKNLIVVDSLFEGILNTEVIFQRKNLP